MTLRFRRTWDRAACSTVSANCSACTSRTFAPSSSRCLTRPLRLSTHKPGLCKNRWSIAALIACAIAISYFYRQTLAVAITAIQRDFPISNTDYAHLQVAFLLAYAVMYAGGGKL